MVDDLSKTNLYDRQYADDGYYWGTKHSNMCERLLQFAQPSESNNLSLIDLGCGEGQNLVRLAKAGFEVMGVDLSPVGLDKVARLSKSEGVAVETKQADIIDYQLAREFDVIFSSGSLQYLAPEIRSERFDHFKSHTSAAGLNVMSVFVEKPFIDPAPDAEDSAFPYHSGEVMSYYHDWEILFSAEEIFACNSSGIPHRHAISRIIARRP